MMTMINKDFIYITNSSTTSLTTFFTTFFTTFLTTFSEWNALMEYGDYDDQQLITYIQAQGAYVLSFRPLYFPLTVS